MEPGIRPSSLQFLSADGDPGAHSAAACSAGLVVSRHALRGGARDLPSCTAGARDLQSCSAVGSVAPLLGTRASSGTPQLSLCSLPNATGGFSFKGKREKKRVLVLLRRRRGVTGEPLTMQ